MSSRSSVTRQLSQESDANNNNFGSPLINGQAVQFVVPNMQPPGASYNQSAALPQYTRMAAVPNGGNPTAAYGTPRNLAPRPVAMSSSMPVSFNPMNAQQSPMLGAQAVFRHPTSGNVAYYTAVVDPASGVIQPSSVPQGAIFSSTSFQPNPMANPPPTSNVDTAPFYPNPGYIAFPNPAVTQFPPQFGRNPQYAPVYLNGQAAAAQAYLAQQQQQLAAGAFIMPPTGTYDYGQLQPMGQVQQQPMQAAVVNVSMPNTASTAVEIVQQPQEPYQPYPNHPAEQQEPQIRKKNILKFTNPDTGEDVIEKVVKEKDEENRQRHQKYVGGLWKPTAEQQLHMSAENVDGQQPSRSASATPSTLGQGVNSEISQTDAVKDEIINDYYNAFTEAVAAGAGFGSSSPTDSQYLHQSDRVIMPPTSSDYSDSSSQIQFGVDESMLSGDIVTTSSKGKGPKDSTLTGVEFGWVNNSTNGEDEHVPINDPMANDSQYNARDEIPVGNRPISKSSTPVESKASRHEDLHEAAISDAQVLDTPAISSQEAPDIPDISQPENVTEGAADESDFDLSTTKDGSSKMDDSSLMDQSMATSVDDEKEADDSGKPDEDNELVTLKVELENLADPNGKRSYSHEFMLLAAKLPESKIKPHFNTARWTSDNIDDVFNLRKGHSSQTKSGGAKFPIAGGASDFSTPWMTKVQISGPPSGRRPYPGRSSDSSGSRGGRGGSRHGGRGSTMKQPPIILGAPQADVELKTAENAWKAGRKAEAKGDPERIETEKLFKEVRGILNKITPQTLEELTQEFLSLEPRMNTKERAEGIVDIVFQKAVDEPKFCTIYSELYDRMTKLQLQKQQQAAIGAPTKSGSITLNKETNFRFILLSKCQAEFEKDTRIDALKKEREEIIAAAETPEKKKQLQEELDETLMKEKRQTLGNMRFIGELYHKNMLTAKIMHMCVAVLLRKSSDDEESLECLCNLLTTIGKKLDSDRTSEFHNRIDDYYGQLEQLARTQQNRYRFMILDLLDLRKSGWQPRRKGDGPKRIDQIHQEAELEKLNEKIAIEQHELNKQLQAAQEDSPTRGSRRGGRRPDLPNRGSYGAPDRMDYENRGARPSMGRDQGRQHGGIPQQMHMSESASKFKQPALSQHLDPTSMKLGPPRSWSKGAGVTTSSPSPAASSTLPRPAQQDPIFRSANRFDHLSMTDERRATGSASSSRESSQTRYDERKKAVENVRQFVGSPTATSKPSERRDGSEDAQRRDSSDVGADMDDSKTERYAHQLIDELADTGDFKEALQLIQERNSTVSKILFFALNHVIDKTEKHRKITGRFIARLFMVGKYNADISKGFALFIHDAIEVGLATDVPTLWAFIGQVLAAALLENETANKKQFSILTEFREAFREAGSLVAAELLAQTLLAVKRDSSSDELVVRLYRSVSDHLEADFSLNSDQVAKAFRKHELDFLLNLPSSADSISSLLPSKQEAGDNQPASNQTPVRVQLPPAAAPAATFPYGLPSPGTHSGLLRVGGQLDPLDPDRIEMERLIQSGEKLAVDRLIEFLQSIRRLSGNDERSLAFLGALIKSLCSKIIVGGDLDDSIDIDDDELDNFCKVLEPFVKSRESLGMKTLDALSEFYHSVNCPKGLLVKILTSLHEKGLIEPDCFRSWWQSGNVPAMVHSSGEVKLFFSKFVDDPSDAGSESDQGE